MRKRKENAANIISKSVKGLSNRKFLQILYFDVICSLNKKVSFGRGLFKYKNKSRKVIIQYVLKLNNKAPIFVMKYM